MIDQRIVAIASLVPGLGFALQGNYKQAALSFLVIAGLLAVFLYAQLDYVAQFSCTLLGLVWIGQGYLAFDIARRDRRIQRGETAAPRQVMPLSSVPPDLPRSMRLSYRVRQTLEQQALPGEHLREVVYGTAMPTTKSHILFGAAAFYGVEQYYVGLSDDGLLLLHLDFWGKPAEVTRISKAQIKDVAFKKSLLSGRLDLQAEGVPPLRLTVPRVQREAAQAIAGALSSGST